MSIIHLAKYTKISLKLWTAKLIIPIRYELMMKITSIISNNNQDKPHLVGEKGQEECKKMVNKELVLRLIINK